MNPAAAPEVVSLGQRLRAETAVALAVHEHPDLDALGAAVGLLDIFRRLGVPARLHTDAVSSLPQVSFGPTPAEVTEAPLSPAHTLYALDAGDLGRLALNGAPAPGTTIVNIDHHHDNTRFGTVDVVMPLASSVSEIVCLLADVVGVPLSSRAAAALYAGVSFDSGHFRHASTSATTFRCAARLVEWGADPTAIYAELYEHRSLADLRLLSAAVRSLREVAGGRALVAVLTRDDFAAAAAGDADAEGIVEALLALEGVHVSALVKEQDDGPPSRVSLRSRGWDVSLLAAERGGGGHRQAAGFSADDTPKEVAEWLSSVLDGRLSTASS